MLAALALLEFGARACSHGGGSGPAELPWGHSNLARSSSNYVPDPFTSFALNPLVEGHSRQGFRAGRAFSPGHDTFRIAVLGGAEAYGTQVRPEQSFPARLEHALRSSGPKQVEVINAGVGAYSTANLIGHLALRVAELDPQVCLFVVGYVDAAARIRYSGFRGDYTHDYKTWDLPTRPWWRTSRFLDGFASALGRRFDADPSIHSVCQLPESGDPVDNLARSSSEPFERNLRTLIGICKAHSIVPVLATQPYDYVHHRPDSHDELWRAATLEHNQVVKRLSLELGVDCIDLDAEVSGMAEYFEDDRRPNVAGCLRWAEIAARELVARGIVP